MEALIRMKKITRDDIIKRLWKIVKGGVGDGVRLAVMDAEEARAMAGRLDLSMISEIKRNSGGNLEIKFLDRIAALKLLADICDRDADINGGAADDFFRALDEAARFGGGE
jgi:hypothetical protein